MCGEVKVEEPIYIYPGVVRRRELRFLKKLDGRVSLVAASINEDNTLGHITDAVELYRMISNSEDEVIADAWEQISLARQRERLHERDDNSPCTCFVFPDVQSAEIVAQLPS